MLDRLVNIHAQHVAYLLSGIQQNKRKEVVNMQTRRKKFNPSKRSQYCSYDFCLNDCAECDERPKPRKRSNFNPSMRHQKNGICKDLPYPGALVVTRAEWIGDAYYIEAIYKYHANKRIHGISW
jgi:hypothetical protein